MGNCWKRKNKSGPSNLSDFSNLSFHAFAKSNDKFTAVALQEQIKKIYDKMQPNPDESDQQETYNKIFRFMNNKKYSDKNVRDAAALLQANQEIIDAKFKERLSNYKRSDPQPSVGTPAFKFEDPNPTGPEENANIITLSDEPFAGGDENKYRFSGMASEYPESVDKDPVFETHANSSRINKPFASIRGFNHSFLGLRFTTYNPKTQEYKREFLRVGFGGLNIGVRGLGIYALSSVLQDTRARQSISTQRTIKPSQVDTLFQNIRAYFRHYKKFNTISRNCNTFVYEISKSMGLTDVAKLHRVISPGSAANNILRAMSKEGDSDKYFSEFDGWRSPTKPPKNGGKRTCWKIDNETLSLQISKDEFLKEAQETGKSDLGFLSRKKRSFRSTEVQRAIEAAANSISDVNKELRNFNDDATGDMLAITGNASIILKDAMKKTGKYHRNLNLYLMSILSMVNNFSYAMAENIPEVGAKTLTQKQNDPLFKKSYDSKMGDTFREISKIKQPATFIANTVYGHKNLNDFIKDTIFYNIFFKGSYVPFQQLMEDISRIDFGTDAIDAPKKTVSAETTNEINIQIRNIFDLGFKRLKDNGVQARLSRLASLAYLKCPNIPDGELSHLFVFSLYLKIADELISSAKLRYNHILKRAVGDFVIESDFDDSAAERQRGEQIDWVRDSIVKPAFFGESLHSMFDQNT